MALDINIAKNFLNVLFEQKSPDEFIEIRIINRADKKSKAEKHFFKTVDELLSFLNEKDIHGKMVSVGIHPRAKQEGTSDAVAMCRFAVLDFDYEDNIPDANTIINKLLELGLTPTFVIFSGQKGYHIYFKLPTPVLPDDWVKIQRYLIDRCIEHGLPADKNIKDVARVMRLPGTLHDKTGKKVEIVYENKDAVLNVSEIMKEIQEAEKRKLQKEYEEWIHASSKEVSQQKLELIDFFKSLWVQGSRQNLALFLSGLLYKKGWSEDDVKDLIVRICETTGDDEKSMRLKAVEHTFKKHKEEIKGISGIEEVLESALSKIYPDATPKMIDKLVVGKIAELKKIIGTFETKIITQWVANSRLFVNHPKYGMLIDIIKLNKDGEAVHDFVKVASYYIKKVKLTEITTTGEEVYQITLKPISRRTEIQLEGTLDDLIEDLKKRSGISNYNKLKDVLSTLIETFIDEGYAEQVQKPFTGYGFWYDEAENKIIIQDVFENTYLTPNANEKRVKEAMNELIRIVDLCSVDRPTLKQKIWNILYWGIVSPFGFVRKQNKRVAYYLFITGYTGTAKTSSLQLIKSIWGLQRKPADVEISGTTLSYDPRFAARSTLATFPILSDEGAAIVEKLSDPSSSLAEMMKIAAESTSDMRSHAKKQFIPLRVAAFTVNYDLPRLPNALLARIINIHTTYEESHSPKERTQYATAINNATMLLTEIGSYICSLLMNDEENRKILEIVLTPNMLEAGKQLWEYLFEKISISTNLPDVLPIQEIANETEMLSDIELIFSTIDKDMMDLARRTAPQLLKDHGDNKQRLYEYLICNGFIPYYLYLTPSKTNIVITPVIVNSIRQHFRTSLESGQLSAVARKYDLEYGPRRVIDKSGGLTSKRGIILTIGEFIERLCFNSVYEVDDLLDEEQESEKTEEAKETEEKGKEESSEENKFKQIIKDAIKYAKENDILDTTAEYFVEYYLTFVTKQATFIELCDLLSAAGFRNTDYYVEVMIKTHFLVNVDGKYVLNYNKEIKR